VACRRGGPGDDKCPATPTSENRESNCRALGLGYACAAVVRGPQGFRPRSDHAHTRRTASLLWSRQEKRSRIRNA